uniref:Ribosome biogenesis protein Nop10 n=1 Tax=Caldiarchaeum subterraneum TaxID=311458 RepID=A0A7J3VTC6_CALS0
MNVLTVLKVGRLRRCPSCRTYTLRDNCPKCGEKTISPHPIHFIPDSHLGQLLLKARKKLTQPTEDNSKQ